MTRQQKPPAQRAQEQLDIEVRRVKRLTDKRHQLQQALDDVDKERDEAVVRRDYLAKHPDLQKSTTTAPPAQKEHTA